ncbi:MAG TPA: carbohydrate binding family 9 domain-containing protein, partial [Longimicrobium sp.]
MRVFRYLPLAAALVAAAPAAAQDGGHASGTTPGVSAHRATDIVLDGRLDEAAWSTPDPATGFRQQQPNDGAPAQRTEVRFAFDDGALYVGARMFDSLGAAGVSAQLTRRDQQVESDYIQLVFDTYHDHAGRTVLQVNPSGVKFDAGQASPNADPSWDPVWEVRTRVDSAGWTAEMRIPWSQLRFSGADEQTWGLQIWRYVQRLNEQSMWSYWGRQESGGPARFGHLAGITIGKRPRGLEIMPYALARAAYVTPTQPGSPFQSEQAYDTRVGADVRALLGGNLTLTATINPDFGQVEQDPA